MHFNARCLLEIQVFKLTVREGAATYSLVEYCHKEHVTVLEIRFHFIDGLDPESER